MEVKHMPEDRPTRDLATGEFPESMTDAEAELTERVWNSLLSAMIDLSPMERAVLALYNAFAFTPAEVASILQVDESDVNALTEGLRRRMAAMSPALKPTADPDDDVLP
jgi:DNA-directed RNA polymerase specialized sigma24 family protein